MSMIPIASATSTGSSDTITFSNIPQTFTHLQLRCFWNTSATAASEYTLLLTFNGDSFPNSNYANHNLAGNGTSATSGAQTSNWTNIIGSLNKYGTGGITPSSTTYSVSITDILDYTNTNKNKTTRAIAGTDYNGSGAANLFSNVYMQTTAITSMSVICGGGSAFRTGTVVSLYGITNSPATGA